MQLFGFTFGPWYSGVLIVLSCTLAIALIWGGHVEGKNRPPLAKRPQEYEPVLWAEPGSWWKVPLYRLEKFVFVDCISPGGGFLALNTWLCRELLPMSFKDAWLVPSVLLALQAVACFNFALPKYRGLIVGMIVQLGQGLASRLGGWTGNPPPPITDNYGVPTPAIKKEGEMT